MLRDSWNNLGTLTLKIENLTNGLKYMWQLLDTMSMHVTPYTTSYYRYVTLTLHVI